MAYLCTRHHTCGEKIHIEEDWNGLEYIISFRSFQDDSFVDNCSQCEERLYPSDMGKTLLTESDFYEAVQHAG